MSPGSVTLNSPTFSTPTAAQIQGMYAQFANGVRVTVGGQSVTLRSNGIPEYPSPYFGAGHSLYEAPYGDGPRTPCDSRVDVTAGPLSVCRASGYARPVPGVPLDQNLKGLSFAVANVTGVLACELTGASRPSVDAALEHLGAVSGA